MRICCAAICLLIITQSAQAEEKCPPLKLVTTIQMVPDGSGTREYVPVQLAGVTKLMILDTGTDTSMISRSAVDELKLRTYKSHVQAFGVTGRYWDQEVEVTAKLGNMAGPLKLVVRDSIESSSALGPIDGLLGADVLGNFDVSVDFGTQTLDLIDQNHCAGKVFYWPARPAVAVPFDFDGGWILLNANLDGKQVTAMLDTGAPYSVLFRHVAEAEFGIKPGAPDTPKADEPDERSDVESYDHRFKTLSFGDGGLTVSNPMFRIIADRMSSHFEWVPTGSNIRVESGPTKMKMILGMNVLKHLHVYIAYKERKLYITPASAPATETKTN